MYVTNTIWRGSSVCHKSFLPILVALFFGLPRVDGAQQIGWHGFPESLPAFAEFERAQRKGGEAHLRVVDVYTSSESHCIDYRFITTSFNDLQFLSGDRPIYYADGDYRVTALRYRVMPRRIQDTSGRRSQELVCIWRAEKLYWRLRYGDGRELIRQFLLVRVRAPRKLWLGQRWEWKELPRNTVPFTGEAQDVLNVLLPLVQEAR